MTRVIAILVFAFGVTLFALGSLNSHRREAEHAAELAWLHKRIAEYRQIIDVTCNVIGE
jgi:preprotein translocase subunit SecG